MASPLHSYSAAALGSTSASVTPVITNLDVNHPYFLHPSDNPGMMITTVILTEQNYSQWQRSMEIALSSKLKLGFVDGSYVKPAVNSALLVHWTRCNNMVSASASSILDHNGYKDIRSWLRNGIPEESQPQYLEGVKFLPRPLPMPVENIQSPNIEDGVKEGKDEGEVEQLSSKQLLQRHIKRSIKVRARIREERLQRIARYRTRLALLFPPIVEQQFRCDKASGT